MLAISVHTLFRIVLNITNKIQRYTIFFITVNALHVSGGFSAHHQELKNRAHSIWYMPSLLATTAFQRTHASGSSKQASKQASEQPTSLRLHVRTEINDVSTDLPFINNTYNI